MMVLDAILAGASPASVVAEASWSDDDVPDHFFLVFRFSASPMFLEQAEGTARELEAGRMEGVRGISGNPDILNSFFGVAREAALMMDGKRFAEANPKMSRVLYANPEYLASNDMAALFRIFDAGGADHHKVLGNILEYAGRVAKTKARRYRENGDYQHHSARLSYALEYHGTWRLVKTRPRPIRNTWDLADWLIAAMKSSDEEYFRSVVLTREEARDYITAALLEIGRVYSSEGEWLLKSGHAVIPHGSTIFLQVPMVPDQVRREISDGNPTTAHVWRDIIRHYDETTAVLSRHRLTGLYEVRLVAGGFLPGRDRLDWRHPDKYTRLDGTVAESVAEIVSAGKHKFAGEMLDRYLIGTVTVLGKAVKGGFAIEMFHSAAPGQGDGEAALSALKAKFGKLIVRTPVADALGFWKKMKARGHIAAIRR